MEDENGLEFPWRRKKFADLIKGKLMKDNKEVEASEELKGKTVGLYFSAHWVGLSVIILIHVRRNTILILTNGPALIYPPAAFPQIMCY